MNERQQLRYELEKADPKDEALFANLIRRAMSALDMSEAVLARELGMSRPSVKAWFNGAKPLPGMRALVYEHLIEKL